MTAMMSEADVNISRAQNVIDKVWQNMRDHFMMRVSEGRPVESLPDLSEAASARKAGEARATLAEIDAIDIGALPHQMAITLKMARFQIEVDTQASERYWLAGGNDSFSGMFPIAPYGGGYPLNYVSRALTSFVFARPGDCDRYLALLEDYARLMGEVRDKLVGQAARGIRIPKPALAGARAVVAAQFEAVKGFAVQPSRLATISAPAGFADSVARRIEERVMPALAALRETVGADYEARAPEDVGMSQFENGLSVYEKLLAESLSMPGTVESVHRAGHERMAVIEAAMAEIRAKLGYKDRADFHRYLLTDPAWVAQTPADVQKTL